MDCKKAADLLNDYVDGSLDAAEERLVREHLAACETCRREEADLNALVEKAGALPGSIAPERDLWPSIRSRIEEGRGAASPVRRPWAAVLFRGLAAAVVVLAIGAALLATRHEALSGDASEEVLRAQTAEEECEKARQDLREALERCEELLPPETLAVIEGNLTVIEQAAQDIRFALAEEPDNEHLERMLAATYRHELALVRQAVRLATDG